MSPWDRVDTSGLSENDACIDEIDSTNGLISPTTSLVFISLNRCLKIPFAMLQVPQTSCYQAVHFYPPLSVVAWCTFLSKVAFWSLWNPRQLKWRFCFLSLAVGSRENSHCSRKNVVSCISKLEGELLWRHLGLTPKIPEFKNWKVANLVTLQETLHWEIIKQKDVC